MWLEPGARAKKKICPKTYLRESLCWELGSLTGLGGWRCAIPIASSCSPGPLLIFKLFRIWIPDQVGDDPRAWIIGLSPIMTKGWRRTTNAILIEKKYLQRLIWLNLECRIFLQNLPFVFFFLEYLKCCLFRLLKHLE